MSWDKGRNNSKSILVEKDEKQFRQKEILFSTMQTTLESFINGTFSDNEFTRDQQLAKCNERSDITTYNRKGLCHDHEVQYQQANNQ